MMLFKTSPQGKSRFTYTPFDRIDISRLAAKLAATPPQQAANDIAAALAEVTAHGAWAGQTAENMANLISRAVDDIARQNPKP